MSYIQINELSKSYVDRRKVSRMPPPSTSVGGSNVAVLNELNLEIEEGEFVCILGPSGCGKSTLLRIVAGFDKASSGGVVINGNEVVGPSSNNIFVFQSNGLLPWMTVWQNVELGLRHMDEGKEKEESISMYIEMVDLCGFEDHYPHQLSGGMQRRAELARALVVRPDILFMDEPFTGLDYLTHLRVREEVVNIHEYIGKTMIMVTHFIEDALLMADRIIVLGDSPAEVKMVKTLAFSRPRNLVEDRSLAELRDEVFLMLGVSYAV